MKKLWKIGREHSAIVYSAPGGAGFQAGFLAGMLAVLTLAPLGLMIYQASEIYGYLLISNIFFRILDIILICFVIMIFSGLLALYHSMIIRKFYKTSQLDDLNLKAIFFYNTFNVVYILIIAAIVLSIGGII